MRLNIYIGIMEKRGFSLGKILGIKISIDYSWLVIFVIVTWLFSTSYFPQKIEKLTFYQNIFLGLATSILFFASALAHEITHSVVARKNGMKVKRITLFLFGGISELFEEPPSADVEFKVAIAGPTTSLALSLFFLLAWFVFNKFTTYSIPIVLFSTLFQINLILSIFNLLPGFPLDGGRILRSIVWAVKKDLVEATRVATLGGQLVALFIIFFGIFQIILSGFWGGLWLVLIGLFLNQAATQSYLELKIKEALKGKKVLDFIRVNPIRINPRLSIDEALSEYFLRYNSQSFLVTEGENVIGLISFHDIRRRSGEISENSRVQDIMRVFPKDFYMNYEESALKALKTMTFKEISFIPIRQEGKFIGVITIDEITQYLTEQNVI